MKVHTIRKLMGNVESLKDSTKLTIYSMGQTIELDRLNSIYKSRHTIEVTDNKLSCKKLIILTNNRTMLVLVRSMIKSESKFLSKFSSNLIKIPYKKIPLLNREAIQELASVVNEFVSWDINEFTDFYLLDEFTGYDNDGNPKYKTFNSIELTGGDVNILQNPELIVKREDY